jgi:hypothetical protein
MPEERGVTCKFFHILVVQKTSYLEDHGDDWTKMSEYDPGKVQIP